jgi:hypothetical protein
VVDGYRNSSPAAALARIGHSPPAARAIAKSGRHLSRIRPRNPSGIFGGGLAKACSSAIHAFSDPAQWRFARLCRRTYRQVRHAFLAMVATDRGGAVAVVDEGGVAAIAPRTVH